MRVGYIKLLGWPITYCLQFYLVSGLGIVQANSFLQFAQQRVDSMLPEIDFWTDILSIPAQSYIQPTQEVGQVGLEAPLGEECQLISPLEAT
jgi:hypothetical protein